MVLTIRPFGSAADIPRTTRPAPRDPVLYVLGNASGASVSVTDYGARVVSILMPDAAGKLDDVVLGYDSVAGYVLDQNFTGATCGRAANRIGGGAFTLSGKRYELVRNEGENTLHGGETGFDRALWDADLFFDRLRFVYRSPDGEEGFPGACTAEVTYELTDDNVLRIGFYATAAADTLAALTNHSYFNLDGRCSGSVLDHQLQLDADAFCPVGAGMLPTGEKRAVTGTPFDFTRPARVGARIGEHDEQLRLGGGYDHCFVVRGEPGNLRRAAMLVGTSGRAMETWTTFPGLQLYTGNFFSGVGAGATCYAKCAALCLETQYFPNAVNTPGFDAPVVRAGRTQENVTEYRFFIKPDGEEWG